MLNVASYDEFASGASSSAYDVEDGVYDAQCVGLTFENATFEGKTKVVMRLLWQFVCNETTHTIRGNSWTVSANEKAKFRKDLSSWFDKSDWGEICELLVKGKILVKNEDGSAKFDMEQFIGKKAKLMIGNNKSKSTGRKYPVIKQMSPSKSKADIKFDEVPYFLVEGKDIIKYSLKPGIAIRKKKEGDSDVVLNQLPPATDDDDELPFS